MKRPNPYMFLLVTALASCTTQSSSENDLNQKTAYKDVVIDKVPHIVQKLDFCGEACAEMYLRRLGKDMDQNYVFDMSGLDPLKGRGCFTPELVTALKKVGFRVGDVWHKVASDKAEEQMERQFVSLHADLVKGIPSIVCMRYDDGPGASEHFRLVLGYDSKKDELIYHEPAEAAGAYRRISRADFFKLWPLKYDKNRWTLIRIRLETGKFGHLEPTAGFTNADYAQHVMMLKQKIPDKSFTVVLQKPFVVIGNESPTMVRRRAVRTVKWAADKLKKDYFKKDPAEIIDIWLFKDKKSYKKYTWQIFRDRPDTPFGYYSDKRSALIMNIGTGGGTLVHEIVHAFISSNFPQCPAWFNEGLASLYEQCGEKNGHIYGYTNWRLAGLQKCIRAGSLTSFKTLTYSSGSGFYRSSGGDNYAQARYLCYYLQEKKLLTKFYHEFRANYKRDPTGFKTLKKILSEKDMNAFQKRWEKLVLGLTFP